jgi:hydrogenase nickel incorporation protein HypB
MEIKVMKRVLDKNQDRAERIRALLKEKQVKMYNFISSPGAGKTTLLERTLEYMGKDCRIGVIEGDIATDRDAQRLNRFNSQVILINTEGGCHLDSNSIDRALGEFNLNELDLIFIENVGNLVCPAHFDLGETAKVAVVSVSEGDDKPVKYPMLFRDARAVVLNKIDLMEHTNFNRHNFVKDLRDVNPEVPLMEISCTANTGMESWFEWMRKEVNFLFS